MSPLRMTRCKPVVAEPTPSPASSPQGTTESEVSSTPSTPQPRPPKRARGQPRRDPSHIPRPRNAFILFRCDFVRRGAVPADIENDHRNISRIVGRVWKLMSDAEQKPWRDAADAESLEHALRYPHYKYQPNSARPRPARRARLGAPPPLDPELDKLANLLVAGSEGADLAIASGRAGRLPPAPALPPPPRKTKTRAIIPQLAVASSTSGVWLPLPPLCLPIPIYLDSALAQQEIATVNFGATFPPQGWEPSYHEEPPPMSAPYPAPPRSMDPNTPAYIYPSPQNLPPLLDQSIPQLSAISSFFGNAGLLVDAVGPLGDKDVPFSDVEPPDQPLETYLPPLAVPVPLHAQTHSALSALEFAMPQSPGHVPPYLDQAMDANALTGADHDEFPLSSAPMSYIADAFAAHVYDVGAGGALPGLFAPCASGQPSMPAGDIAAAYGSWSPSIDGSVDASEGTRFSIDVNHCPMAVHHVYYQAAGQQQGGGQFRVRDQQATLGFASPASPTAFFPLTHDGRPSSDCRATLAPLVLTNAASWPTLKEDISPPVSGHYRFDGCAHAFTTDQDETRRRPTSPTCHLY